MKISKKGLNSIFLTKIEIKMTPLLVLFCYLLPLFVLSHLEDTFFLTRQHSYFGVIHCENSEFQIPLFSK